MKILITGGAGFIGCNTTLHFAKQGHDVVVLDNLSRETAIINLKLMQGNQVPFQFKKLDISDKASVEEFIKQNKFDVIIHLAGQVAVTLSVKDPWNDFVINAQGTLNILESIRKHLPHTVFINASTNKVYGKSADQTVIEKDCCYKYEDLDYNGVCEKQQLDFYSPYGCSKGVADQYTIDYARIYGLKTVSVRQSCIYGPNQFGIEDQGWIAWFILAYLQGKQIKIYGNGKQVRDVLYVSDLVYFYEQLIQKIDVVKGHAFNIGGGVKNSLSLLQFFKILEKITGKKIPLSFDKWRPGDQFIFVSDNSKAKELVGFEAKTDYVDGIRKTYIWLKDYLSNQKINKFASKEKVESFFQ
jgi:CDP-paratose 2-epimerase